MAIEVVLPQWGMAMREGTVLSWFKAEGDSVTEDEDLVEIEAEKTTAIIGAPETGTLSKILVREEETIDVGTVLGLIEPT